MATIPLTKRTLDALQPREKPFTVFDGGRDLPGFGVRVMPSGHKGFILEYRPREAGEAASRSIHKKRYSLGTYGPVTAEQARRRAAEALVVIRNGGDPQAARSARRAAATVSKLIDAFMTEHVETKCKSATAEAHKVALERLRVAHGSLKADALTRGQVALLHTRLSNAPFAANRFLAVVSKLFSWASNRELLPETHPNPAAKIERYREQGRERYLTSDELARLGAALAEAETIGLAYTIDETKAKAKHAPKADNRRVKLDPFAVAAIRLLILTGARLREILDAKWEQVDLERGVIFLPDSKTGKKPIYLSAAAQVVLAALPRIKGNPHIIAGAKDGAPRADLKKPWAAVTRAAGLEGVRLHDLRHSFASFGAGASLGLPIIGKLLGHTQATTTQRYAHLDADPLRRAADAIGTTIAAAMDGGRGAKILPMPKRQEGGR
ncbi:site-specific integrase [Methylocystis sp. B8]|uniref:site-specific integrase n=1 Tax=Methylocystis sp. B8 TaxID=544938 RepID=UPI0010FE280D|nr:site-specific integrase [Methylocystis sp. B8]TLG72785.1 site-specific integrase [Methylocystis sp. B8]